MKRTTLPLLAALLLAILAACNRHAAPATPTAVAIDERNFPDPNLRAFLLAQPYGADSLLTTDEIAAVTSLNLSSLDIADLTGIHHFTALKDLACVDNRLDSLSLDSLPRLSYLNCAGNRLTTLRLTNLPHLNYLGCGQNRLTTLDLSHLPDLHAIDCPDNQLVALDFTHNPTIASIFCCGNQLNAQAVDTLVSSLHQNTTDLHNTIYLYNRHNADDHTTCTPRQAAAARTKGWTIYHLVAEDWQPYDTPTH